MDELLTQVPQSQVDGRPSRPADLGRRFRDAAQSWLSRWDAFRARHRAGAGLFLLAALTVGVLTTAHTVYAPGYAIMVDGRQLGVVADTAEFEEIVDRVEARASRILGYDYTLACGIEYREQVVERTAYSTLAGVDTFLFNQVGEIMKSDVLVIGGEVMGATDDGERLQMLLDSLMAPYVNSNTIQAEFTVPVELRCEYTAAAEVRPLREYTDLLTANSIEEATYTVAAGDTYIGIARHHAMSLDELLEMNPQATLSSLFPGDELVVRQSVPYLSVRTVDSVSYRETVEQPVEYVDDATMYQGDTKVLEEGTPGMALVSAHITYINGSEQSRDVVSRRVLTEPTVKVVAQGTKERPKTMPKGYFIWPCKGYITSNYGYRSIFGSYSFHGGIDIGVVTGTSIKAADGGTVKFAGWHDSYGYLVILDHGNGKTSYYGHNSKLLVNTGDKVYQGQIIAKSGATGNVTGPHCHFEVRINGVRVDPRKYLP